MNDYPRQNPAYRLTQPHITNVDTMTIEDAIHQGKRLLEHLPSPQFEAELLLAYLLKRNRSYLVAFPEKELADDHIDQYLALLARRANGEPFAYITGEKEFFGLQFEVNQHTLIPRDDTEILIEEALKRIPITADNHFSIVDLGTGSGAIAMMIKHERPQISVTAVDYYPNTLEIAKKNARNNGLDIHFIESHWFQRIPQKSFDMIVSNPPYIDPNDEHLDGDGVRFEPKQALIADQKGLADLFHIIDTAPLFFKSTGGYLLLEHGYNQAEALQTKMKQSGFKDITTIKDLGKNDRVTLGFFSSPLE